MNPRNRSFFQELGVQPNCTQEEIRDAYRRLAKQYHPDLNRGDPKAEDRFKRINEAYHALLETKAKVGKSPAVEPQYTSRKSSRKQPPGASFTEIFDRVFKAKPRTSRRSGSTRIPRRGKDLKMKIELDLVELASGARKTVLLTREGTCRVCKGTGIKPGHKPIQCKICLGIGEVPVSREGKTVFKTCPNCKGTGSIIKDRCINCGGRGIARGKSQVTIDIPPSMKEGQILTIRGLGNAGRWGAPNGDLHVEIAIQESPYFQATGSDITYECPLTLLEIMLGGEVEVPTPRGKVKLTLTPGLESNKTLRVKGKGLPKPDGGYGDLLVRVRYHMPKRLSKKAQTLLEQLVALPGWTPKRDSKGFIPKSPGE